MKLNKIYIFLIGVLIIGGVFLRFYNLRYNTQFNWDQENSLAYPAKDIIINHHPTLIGPRTSVGGFYLGPYYTYFVTLFYAVFHMDPIAGALSAAVIATITIIVGYYLISSYFGKETGLLFTLIWSVSSFLISLDRIPWNVNLFGLCSLLVTIGALYGSTGKQRAGNILIGLGLMLGISSHFSVVMLIGIVSVWIFLYRHHWNREIGFLLVGLCVGLAPLFIFEIRHGFIMSGGTASFANGVLPEAKYIPERIVMFSRLIFETIGRIPANGLHRWVAVFISIIGMWILYSVKEKELQVFKKLFLLYLTIYISGYTLYSGNVPEYYFTGLFPPAVIMFALCLKQFIHTYSFMKAIILFWFGLMCISSFRYVASTDPQGLGIKQEIVALIKERVGDKPVSVIRDMELSASFGFDYLFEYKGVKLDRDQNNPNTYWISYPVWRAPYLPDRTIGSLAVSYPETTEKIYKTKDVKIFEKFTFRIPKSWNFVGCGVNPISDYLVAPTVPKICTKPPSSEQAIIITTHPNCTLQKFVTKAKVDISSRVPIYRINTEEIAPAVNGYSYVFTADDYSCITITDKIGRSNTLTPEMTDILNSLK